MKVIKKITVTLLILTLNVSWIPVPKVNAQETEMTKAEKACQKEAKAMDFDKLHEDWAKKLKGKPFDSKAAQNAYELAQEAYHEYVECIFDFAESEILKKKMTSRQGIGLANTPNTPNVEDVPVAGYLIDWMSPATACMEEEAYMKVIEDTNPGATLIPVQHAHYQYEKYLKDTLLALYYKNGIEVDSSGKALTGYDQIQSKTNAYKKFESEIENEIENSIVAMDIAFISLRELRTAFVMHVQFQCMLKNLEKYRKVLEDIRIIVDTLPGRLRDASTH